jgi:hypothetical protein
MKKKLDKVEPRKRARGEEGEGGVASEEELNRMSVSSGKSDAEDSDDDNEDSNFEQKDSPSPDGQSNQRQ